MTGYRHDHAAFGELVLNAPWMVEAMASRAERGAEFARGIAPVDTESSEPGRYRDSISTDSGRDGGIHGDRAYGRVYSEALTNDGRSLAVFVEFGTEHNDAHHVMLRALDAMQ